MKEKDFWGGARNADCLFLFESGDMSGPPLCTAPDFLDTVVVIFKPTSGSHRSAIVAPQPAVCVVL